MTALAEAPIAINVPAPQPELRIQDVITLTARLAQLLAEEVDHLAGMRMDEVEKLQSEKLFLAGALDAQRRLLAKYPHLKDGMSPREREDLRQVVEVFNGVLEKNHRRLMLAREVNRQIVGAITTVVRESTMRCVYDGKGYTGGAPFETLSVTLNKTI